jgi:glutamate/tyrosine decarboxylase-like PLP-dependent enzyme
MAQVRHRLRAPLVAIRTVFETLHREPEIELLHQPDTGILCFRMAPEGLAKDQLDALQTYIYAEIKRAGKRSISITKVDGKTVLRLVAISPSVTADALLETIGIARTLARGYRGGPTL